MILLISLLMMIAIILIVTGISSPSRATLKGVRLSKGSSKMKIRSLLGYIFPFSKILLEKLKLDVKIRNQLHLAHLGFTPEEFFNLKLILMVLLSIISNFALGKFDPVVLVISLAFGYIAPDIWLNQKIRQYRYKIARVVPETVDLLALCIEGGLDFTSGIKWLVEKASPSDNPMLRELAFVLEEIKWGKSRAQALKDMAKRLNIPEVSSFVQTLVQAERMGTSVSETFAILSEDTRLQRFHRGERYAMQAPIKILIPLIFCILPVIAIIIGGPILLQFLTGGLLRGF